MTKDDVENGDVIEHFVLTESLDVWISSNVTVGESISYLSTYAEIEEPTFINGSISGDTGWCAMHL